MDAPVTPDERDKDCHPHTQGTHQGWSPVPPRKGQDTPLFSTWWLLRAAAGPAKLKQVMGLRPHKSVLTLTCTPTVPAMA